MCAIWQQGNLLTKKQVTNKCYDVSLRYFVHLHQLTVDTRIELRCIFKFIHETSRRTARWPLRHTALLDRKTKQFRWWNVFNHCAERATRHFSLGLTLIDRLFTKIWAMTLDLLTSNLIQYVHLSSAMFALDKKFLLRENGSRWTDGQTDR